jgi:hypothetical protein
MAVVVFGAMASVSAMPIGWATLTRTELPLKAVVARGTPLAATDYLQRQPPRGQVFNTMEWGDYLLWAGPPDLQVFADSHVHLLPPEVWEDYLAIVGVVDGWEELLSKYDVQTIVLDRWYRWKLISRIEASPRWQRVHQDSFAAIYIRRNP